MFAISMVIINQSNNPVYAQVQPSNFTSNNDTGVQSYTYENGQNEIIKAEPKPAPIVAPGTTSNDTQIRQAVNEVTIRHFIINKKKFQQQRGIHPP
jgi:hypothetical protein